jgi:YfiH family protein
MLTKNYDLGNRVTAFSTMREGGVSTGNYASFNINHYCGDSEEHIARNLEILSERLNIPTENFIYPHQTHSKVVRGITQEFFSLSKAEQKEYIEGVDALITDITGICIGVSTADCIPVLVYDPEHHCAAAIHAGWRGTVQRIVEEAVKAMAENYGSRPESLRAAIGPGISLQSFEVGDEVYTAFLDAQFPMDKIARRFPLMNGSASNGDSQQEKWHIDLPECNRLQLLSTGVPAAHIAVSQVCTFQQSDTFFSARRLGIDSGRIFTGILLRAKKENA